MGPLVASHAPAAKSAAARFLVRTPDLPSVKLHLKRDFNGNSEYR
jgi:hypothetical protein